MTDTKIPNNFLKVSWKELFYLMLIIDANQLVHLNWDNFIWLLSWDFKRIVWHFGEICLLAFSLIVRWEDQHHSRVNTVKYEAPASSSRLAWLGIKTGNRGKELAWFCPKFLKNIPTSFNQYKNPSSKTRSWDFTECYVCRMISWQGAVTSWSLCRLTGNLTMETSFHEVTAHS